MINHPGIQRPEHDFVRERWSFAGRLVLTIGLVVALAPIFLILLQLNNRVGLQNVTRYEKPEYLLDDNKLCPGDTLAFTPTLIVTSAPVLVEITSTWWDVANRRTVVQARQSDVLISIFKGNGRFSRTISVTVPKLEPGYYEYLRATESTSGSQVALMSVPFVVPEDCASH